MNKKMFLKELEEKTKLSTEQCLKINNILEDTFPIGKKNKEQIISRLIDEINLSEEKASDVYNTASHIIANEIKEKIKHPFKSLD